MRFLLPAILTLSAFTAVAQTPNLHWKYQDDGKSYAEDRGICTAFDGSGNIITAGYAEQGCTETDIIVIKYTPAGDTLWKTTYDGSGTTTQEDYPAAMTLDAAGNIYVTGKTEDNNFFHAVTLKLDPQGNIEWAERYMTAQSEAYDISVDPAGDVVICGYRETAGDKDYMVLKYSNSGNLQWSFFAVLGAYSEALAVRTDLSGNIFVTGKANIGFSPICDWYTQKLGPGGNSLNSDYFSPVMITYSAEPVDLEIDSSGNVYVTGAVQVGSSNRDFYVIKYDASLNRIWENSFFNPSFTGDEIPVDMTVDHAGNVFVTGNGIFFPSGQDITTVKFNSSGQLVWYANIDSLAMTDYARRICLDPTGNFVYVAGDISVPPPGFINRDIIVMKYDTSGIETAQFVGNGPGNNFDLPYDMEANAAGDICVTGMQSMHVGGTGNGDITTLLLNDQLQPQLILNYNGDSFADDQGTDMVVDASGNSYVCGFTRGGDITNEDLVVFKVAPNGDRLWRFVFRGLTEYSSDKAVAIAIDDQQNTYVTGTTDSAGGTGTTNIYTVKLNAAGNMVWERTFNGTLNGSDGPVGIAVAPNGNVYVAATTVNTSTLTDGTIICYSTNGVPLWSTNLDKGGLAETFSTLIADDQNFVYAAGAYYPSSGAMSDGLLAKFDPSGTILWDTTYDFSTANSDIDYWNSIDLDTAGNVFVAGQANFDFVTAKYSPSGNPEWIQNYSFSSFEDSAAVIKVDVAGDVIVGGTFGQFVEADYGIVKYRNDGTQIWARKYANSAGSDDILTDMALDSIGNIYVTGWETEQFSTNYNFMTLKYDSAGTFIYELIWSDSLTVAPDYGKRIGLDSLGHIYIMGDANENCLGNTFVNGFRWNTQVLRYGQGIFSSDNEPMVADSELKVFPNPSHGTFNMLLPEAIFGKATAAVSFYDVQGKLILTKMCTPGELLTITELSGREGLFVFTAGNDTGYQSGRILIQSAR